MASVSKDSPEVIEFMRLFSRLKDWSDDNPDNLFDLAKTDTSIKNLCECLFWVCYVIKYNERNQRELFTGPVDPKFLDSWRNYEECYEYIVGNISLSDLCSESDFKKPSKTSSDLKWKNANDEATNQAQSINDVIKFAEWNADQDDRWNESQEDFIQGIKHGAAAWDRLNQDTGFNLQSIFRRRALVPFVLVPRKLTFKHKSKEKILRNLQQAHDAFIFGTPHAALALMRSIVEAVLRDHYGATGADLSDLINNVPEHCLPSDVKKAALHRIRILANDVLHLRRENNEGLMNKDDVQFEKTILFLLVIIRRLIEGVK